MQCDTWGMKGEKKNEVGEMDAIFNTKVGEEDEGGSTVNIFPSFRPFPVLFHYVTMAVLRPSLRSSSFGSFPSFCTEEDGCILLWR